MKIAFNNFPLQSGHQARGIGSYTRNLLTELKKNHSLEIQEFNNLSEVKEADLVHYPYFDLFQHSLPIEKKFPTVITIHDVTPLVFPNHYPVGPRGIINLLLQKLSLKNVKAIITDSEASKKDLIKYLKINPEIIFPIYLAALPSFKKINDPKLLSIVAVKYFLPKSYVLYFGDVNWNKNLSNLTTASILANVDVVLAGKSFEETNHLDHPELKNFADFLKNYKDNSKVHILGYVPEEDLVSLINLAKAVLLPSLYEGFGLPILEAQSCGTPVITSKISSMPEVAGKGAVLVDPYDVKEMAQAILNILNNSKQYASLIKNGFENIAQFSWPKTVEKTVMVYRYASSK